jgi:hypothetical protein
MWKCSRALKEAPDTSRRRTRRQGSFVTLQMSNWYRSGAEGADVAANFEACTRGGLLFEIRPRHILTSLRFSWFPPGSPGKFWGSTPNNLVTPANRMVRLMCGAWGNWIGIDRATGLITRLGFAEGTVIACLPTCHGQFSVSRSLVVSGLLGYSGWNTKVTGHPHVRAEDCGTKRSS